VNPIFEYIAAIFVVSLIIGYSLYSLNTMSSSQLNIAHEEQLQPVAARLFDKILLTGGYPEDWGSNININQSNLGDFGLSSQSGQMYQVDVNKLMRLVSNVSYTVNPLYIPPTTMGNLTGIYGKNSWSYGFRLLVRTALNISITNGPGSVPSSFTVNVTNYLGSYASNAEVNALYFLIYNSTVGQGQNKTDIFNYSSAVAVNVTDWRGGAVLNFGNSVPQLPNGVQIYAYVLFVTANYYGLQSQQIEVIGGPIQTLNLLVEGDYLIANYTDIDGIAHGAYHLDLTAIEFTSDLQLILNPVTNETTGQAGQVINSGGKNYQVFHLTNPLSEDVIFAGLLVKKTGQWTLATCDRPRVPVAIDYRSHSFAYAGINTDTFSRLITVGRNSYYAELTVWRMSE
jgi:hypothetical protein